MTILDDIDKIIDVATDNIKESTMYGNDVEFTVRIRFSSSTHWDSVLNIRFNGAEIKQVWLMDDPEYLIYYGHMWRASRELTNFVRDRILTWDKYKGYSRRDIVVMIDCFNIIYK